jgi:hypothetical protein
VHPRVTLNCDGHDGGLLPEPPHFAGPGSANRAREAVCEYYLVSEKKGLVRPDENVADPAAVALLPFCRQTRHLAFDDADCSFEGARLAADPALAGQSDSRQGDDHRQVDAQHGQQRD